MKQKLKNIWCTLFHPTYRYYRYPGNRKITTVVCTKCKREFTIRDELQ